jgi:hypothetical protein
VCVLTIWYRTRGILDLRNTVNTLTFKSLCFLHYPLLHFIGQLLCFVNSLHFLFLAWSLLSTHCRCRELLFLITLIDTNTLDRTPLVGGIGPSQGPLPDSTQHSTKTYTCAASGIRNRNPSKRAAVGVRLRQHSHRGRLSNSQQIWPSVGRATNINVFGRMVLWDIF